MRIIIYFCILLFVLVSCGSPAEQNNHGNALTNGGNYSDALIAYSSAQVGEPDNPIVYLNAAKAYFEQGDLNIAIDVLEQAILRGDDDIKAQAYYNMGNFYFLSQQPEDAITAYRESLLINPNDQNTRHNLELAMSYSVTPTPIDDEMKTEPEESQVDISATPTNQPLDQSQESPTPTPEQIVFDERTPEGGLEGDHFGNQGPSTPQPGETPTLSKEEAGDILDPIREAESVYSQFSDEVSTPTNSEEQKSW